MTEHKQPPRTAGCGRGLFVCTDGELLAAVMNLATVYAIADKFGCARPTISRRLCRLESQGLVYRQRQAVVGAGVPALWRLGPAPQDAAGEGL